MDIDKCYSLCRFEINLYLINAVRNSVAEDTLSLANRFTVTYVNI